MKYFWYILLIINFGSFVLNEDLFLKVLSFLCSVFALGAILLNEDDMLE